MGFGSGAFQAARIQIDGVTVIQNIISGKVQSTYTTELVGLPVIAAPSTNAAWGYASYLVNGGVLVNVTENLQWTTPANAANIVDALALTGSTGTIDGTASASSTAKVNSQGVALTTTNSFDVIIVYVAAEGGANSISISDTAGLSWTQRAKVSGLATSATPTPAPPPPPPPPPNTG